MNRFFISMLLLAVFMLFALPVSAAPQPGYTSHGFTVSEVGRIESLGADLVKLTHDRTGARVIFVLNDDTNLGFSICFHTEPADDAGMLHILEHAVCAASEKYPGRDVFFDAISQAYLTGLNAWTSLSSTNYYATSMDENQLEVLTDFYLDCAFNSALITQPNYFRREGWRYEMPTLDDELTINGIVYNEMQGVYGNIEEVAFSNLNRALFPDTYQSRDSGGVPANIPELSYEELISFYKSCYNPANSVSMFYGNVDMERFLALLNDGYFAVVAVGEYSPISEGQKPFDEPVREVCEFPVAEGSENAGSTIFFSTALSEEESADYANYAIADVVMDMLADNSSKLMRALNASGIGSSYSTLVKNIGNQLTLNFYASDADESRDEEFKDIIISKLSEMTGEGFDANMMRSLFAQAEMKYRLQRNSGEVAIDFFENLTWIQEIGNDAPLDAVKWYKKADDMCADGYAEKKVAQWIIDNPHAALVTTVPTAGLLEKNERALADRLAAVKDSMTDDEKQAVVDETREFNEWLEEQTPAETLRKISVVNPATVEAYWPEREITTETKDSVTIISTPASMDMTGIVLSFDLGHLSDEELCALQMLTRIIGSSTKEHSQEEITVSMALLTNSLRARVTALQFENGYRPALEVSWFAPNESVEKSVELAFEIIESTDLQENRELLAQRVDSAISDYRNPETVYDFADCTALASSGAMYGLIDKLSGFGYLSQLNIAKADYQKDPDGFISRLEAIRAKALQRSGALVMLAGDPDGLAGEAVIEKLNELPESNGAALSRDDKSSVKNTAITGSMQASYIRRGLMLDNQIQSVTGDKLVLNRLLHGEYLLPILRFQMGAYSVGVELSMNGAWTANYYRGGTVFAANDVFLGMPEYVENLDIAQGQLDSYKLPTISNLVTPSGELNDALGEMRTGLFGFTREKRLALVEEIRNTTVEQIKALAPVLRDVLDRSGVTVIAVANDLAGHEDYFDAIEQMP